MLRPLAHQELPAATEVLARAFHSDPMFAYLIPPERPRLAWLRAFMRAGLRMLWPAGHLYALGADAPEAVLALLGPGDYPPPLARRLAFSLRLLPRAFIGQPRPGPLWRTRSLVGRLDRCHPQGPHWMLYQVAVRPEAQGRGLGRRLLEALTALVEARPAPVYLDTTHESNLQLYARFGFELTQTIDLGPTVPPVWTMVRPAPAGP